MKPNTSRTGLQNLHFKLQFLFSAWLISTFSIPFLYLTYLPKYDYSSTLEAAGLHACALWDSVGHTKIPILNGCDGKDAAVHSTPQLAADHTQVKRTPLYSAGFTLLFGLLLFGGRQKSAKGAVRDVSEDSEALEKLAKPFDPLKYVDLQKGIFVGLDERRKPVYWRRRVLDKNHLEILGESGVGKSSLAGVMLAQLAAAGECVVVFDPKNDRNLPGVLAEAGRTWGGYPVHILDLRPVAGFPQVNPFQGCRPDQVEELLQVALELGKTGDPGVDFYRGADREATGFLCEGLGEVSMIDILARAADDSRVTTKENLWRELRQLARVKALHTNSGLDLAEVLGKKGVLYVVGSTTKLEVVAVQKLILQRILQILDERTDQKRPVALFLDELKYILSPAALRAAGTIRDRNCHLLFAHQSLGDLDDCPGLNPKAVRGAIWGNSGIKIVYKMLDADTARELESIAGQSAVEAESAGRSDHGQTSTKRVEKSQFMPAHIFTHLPKPTSNEASVGVVFGLWTAFYLSTRWMKAGAAPQPVAAAPVAPVAGSATSHLAEPKPGAKQRRDNLSDLEG